MSRNRIFSLLLVVLSTTISLAAGEAILRIKNSSMTNYDIEMWRYAKELKLRSENPVLAHDHLKGSSSILQSVLVRINEWGLRGGPIPPRDRNVRRILFLGGSITLGWGVRESDTLTEDLARMFAGVGMPTEVLNGGVGNYNAERYVERFFTELKGLEPSDIVVQYFVRDAEKLDPGGGNIFLRNSELAVTLWIAANRLFEKSGQNALLEHYRDVYRTDEPGYQAMLAALKRLAQYAKGNGVRIFLAMTPDVHNLKNYDLSFIHDRMRRIATEYGYTYVDLLPAFGTLAPDEVWAMPGDPHPNALGHNLMAQAIFPVLERPLDNRVQVGVH